jgi:nucleotide-binding universal stress UspA family protein
VATTPGREIIAGYDGSASSAQALDWAVHAARLRGIPLTICHAWVPPAYASANVGAGDDAGDLAREHAEEVLAEGVLHAQRAESAVASRPLLVRGPATRVLCEESADADMLVVGSRGIGGFAGLLLGSVSLQVAAHAPVPVTIVPGGWAPVPGHPPLPVVVGIDGSAGAQAALEFAVTEAELRDVPMVAVCALSDTAGVVGAARNLEADFVSRIGELQADHPAAVIQKRVEQGAPRPALLAAASQAQLLVVGARGRGGLREMALGSVTLAVVHHAVCPVTVVRRA